MKEISDELYEKLDILGLLPNDVRSSNVGNSDYSEQFIQAWTLWQAYPNLTPWDYDILKRVLRTKKGETRKSDYEKIIHDCQERIRQIDVEEKYRKGKWLMELGEDGKFHRVPSRKPTGVLGQMLEEIKEEKEANTKFKKGDWVVVDGYTYQITDVYEDGYANNAQGFFPKDREDEMRLWTIKDAKDGDLIYVCTEEKGIQAIFREYKNKTIFFHCYLCRDFVQGGDMLISDVELVYPLQETHYKRFFEIMYEAGYEWYANTKELRKIEQKQEWSDFDAKMLARAMRAVNYFITTDDHDEANQCFAWLKDIKERYAWKPSEDQMQQLSWVAEQNKDNALGKELMTLYNDLKKLI